MKLSPHMVEKPWGRTDLRGTFGNLTGKRIGEIWFEGPEPLPLLLKFIFTSEKLSIQNHPSDEQARARGLERGKEECWYILDAEPGATLGLGLRSQVAPEELRKSALDGSIEQLVDWKPVEAGDFFYVAAGTVHAIGAGITLVEFQQNTDVTYRLYDYGRPRELHLDDGIAIASTGPYSDARSMHVSPKDPSVLVDGPHFSLIQAVDGHVPHEGLSSRRRWIIPLDGVVRCDGDEARFGECLLVDAGHSIDLGDGRVLIGAEA
jgi:mannose-6-phosphate isomerase